MSNIRMYELLVTAGGNMENKTIKFLKNIFKRVDFLAAMILFAVCLLVVINIILRRLFGSPIHGVYEFVCYFTVFLVSLALANCAMQGGHTNVTFVLEKFSAKLQKYIKVIVGIPIIISLILIIWNLAAYAYDMYLLGYVSSVMRFPLQYILGIIGAGFVTLTIATFIRLIEDVKEKSS